MGRTGTGVEIRGDAIRISFYYEGERHRPTLKVGDVPMKATQANLKYAARLKDEINAKIKNDTFVLAEYFPDGGEAGPTTLAKQLDTWLASQRIAPSTMKGYQAAANFWRRAIGTVPLRSLRLSQIKTALANRMDLSGKTVNNYTSVLRDSLSLAVSDKLMPSNPVLEIKSSKWQRDPPDPFEADERDKLIGYAESKYPPQIANMVAFWFWTGLRTGELLALRWPNVDLAGGTILIRESVVGRVRRDKTKTQRTRTVHLNSLAHAALKAQKTHTYMKGEEVFQDPRHTAPWVSEGAFRKVYWIPMLRATKIRYRRAYQCRHTYATTMLMAGMAPAFCAAQLGHSVQVLLSTYTKWINGQANAREMAKLENSLSPHGGPKAVAETE